VAYSLPTWVQAAQELEDFARSRGVAFGLIYFGDDDVSDDAWLAKAQQRFELYETEGGHPADAVLQSWQDRPDHVLPETKRTFTNLILRYTRTRTRLELETAAGVVKGRLTASRPIAGTRVRLSVERSFAGSAYLSRSVLATVPATTRSDGRFRAQLTAPTGAAIAARYAGSSRYWPAYAVISDGAGLRNVARGRPVEASAQEPVSPAASAVDGDTTTSWNAGQFGPQWIEIDLGAPYTISAIRLGIAQTPRGNTVHAVLGRSPEAAYRELHAFSGTTADNGLLEYVPPMPWKEIRYVRVETRASPSWVSWRELEVFVAD
jgi:hypothetical protein